MLSAPFTLCRSLLNERVILSCRTRNGALMLSITIKFRNYSESVRLKADYLVLVLKDHLIYMELSLRLEDWVVWMCQLLTQWETVPAKKFVHLPTLQSIKITKRVCWHWSVVCSLVDFSFICIFKFAIRRPPQTLAMSFLSRSDLNWIFCLSQSWVTSFSSRYTLLMTKLPHIFFLREKYVQMEIIMDY